MSEPTKDQRTFEMSERIVLQRDWLAGAVVVTCAPNETPLDLAVDLRKLLAAQPAAAPETTPSATGEVREAFLLAANVASVIRDEYEARGRDESLSKDQRERANRDATIARQVKGQILAYAGIQEWPAPKPTPEARQCTR